MKRKLLIAVFAVTAMACIIGAAACAHEHTFSEEWSKDETHHWHGATCGHTEAETREEHGFGEWQVVTPASETEEGEEKRICAVCGYEDDRVIPVLEHVHKYSEDWTYDDTYHWHEVVCGHDVEPEKYNHLFTGGSPVCTACGATNFARLFEFTEIRDGEEITGYSVGVKDAALSETELIIPSGYKGKPVTEIAEQGLNYISAKTVTIPETVESIGDYAFWKSAVEEIIIPDNVKTMGAAFYQCYEIKKIVIGNGLTEIANNTFRETPKLATVIMGNGIKSIGQYAFYQCAVTSMEIPDSVQTMGTYAFYKADALESLKLGNGLTEIPGSAFESCSSLKELVFGENITTIGSSAFSRCASLNEVKLEGKISTVKNGAFNYCENLYSVTIGANVTSLDNGAFLEDYRIAEVCNKSTIEIIKGKVASKDYVQLGNVSQNVCTSENGRGTFKTTEDGYVFYCYAEGGNRYTSLINYIGSAAKLTLPAPSSLEFGGYTAESYVIGAGAFKGNANIEAVTMPAGVTEIQLRAFQNCTSLCELALNGDLTTIRRKAFFGCSGLTVLTVPEAVTTMEIHAFVGCTGLNRIEWNAADCTALEYSEINVGQGWFLEDGKRDTCNSVTEIVFGSGVRTVPAYAFRYMTNVTAISLPASVRNIGNNAFRECGLTDFAFAVTSGWSVTSSTWGNGVTKTPNFSDKDEILSWLCGKYTSSTVWTRS